MRLSTFGLIANNADAMVNTTGSLLQPARNGNVRGLAVTSAKRSGLAPEFPTMQESGVSRIVEVDMEEALRMREQLV